MTERHIADLWCSDVLAKLSDYLDGDLTHAEKARFELHIAECGECSRFGIAFTRVVTSLRALQASEEAPEDM